MFKVLLLSTDPAVLSVTRKFHSLDRAKHEMGELKLAMEKSDVIVQKRVFEGLIQSGMSQSNETNFELSKVLPGVVYEPIIIEEGKKPSILDSLLILLVAFVVTVGILSGAKPNGALPPPQPPTPPRLPGRE